MPFVRATDIKDGEIKRETLFHISKEQPKLMDKCRLSGGELIIVRSGVNTGDCAVIPEDLSGAYAAYDLILTFSPNASAHFVSIFLDTEIGRLQLNLVKGRAAQPHINADEVSALRIPLPNIGEQQNLVAAMDAARAKRRAKLAEADALLAGLDDFLLSTLGLTPPPKDERKVFAVSANAVSARFDPYFYSPELTMNLRMLAAANAQSLGSLTSFSDEIWKPSNHDGATFRYIEISKVSSITGEAQAEESLVAEAPSRARMMVRNQDIIVNLTRPHHGSIAQITPDLGGCIASTGFAVLRNIDPKLNGSRNNYWEAEPRKRLWTCKSISRRFP
ncbi:MAG: restriction endonuclease subunit S [Zoogloeaceae bacterium]|nr:restriction endonuclease subunit S [Zoogloeaceae bacterium]